MAEALQQSEHRAAELGAPLIGSVMFVEASARATACAELEKHGAIVARVDAIAITSRGRLGELILDSLARALDARGIRPTRGALSQDLARALHAGARGVAIVLGSIRALIDQDGALDADDSRTVRALAQRACEMPLVLALDAADATLDAYGAPVPLRSLVLPPVAVETEETPEAEPTPETATPTATATPTPTATPTATATATPTATATATATATPTATATATEPSPAPKPAPILPPPEIWRPWVIALAGARGPQPLASFEKLFVQAYMPLVRAIEDGLDDTRALQTSEEFCRNFARAYTEACPTFAVTGKRPRMVFDAPELASKIARLHGARTTQLLLVDGMRLDVGLRVKAAIASVLESRASLAEEQLLWSALPTKTGRQLELLAHGIEAMRAPGDAAERDAEPMRGRTAETIRRVKIGHRDVFKLDVVQARLAEPLESSTLDEVALQVADAVARHAQTLASRTLLYVFGDHGFQRDREGAVTQGGASPEEVLVPAFSFLVGSVH